MMSGAREATFSMPDATSVEAQAADWLDRRDDQKNWTPELQNEFEIWLGQSTAHRLSYLRLHAAWVEANRLAALRKPKHERFKFFGRRMSSATVKVAGIFIVGGAIGYFSLSAPNGSGVQTYATPLGGRETLKLADGSQIELNTDTAVRISAKSREVWLDRGEAYFQVQHDASRPFTVMVAGHRIIDLGTRFLVQADPLKLRVSLVEGRARVEAESLWNSPQSALLAPGDVIEATATTMALEKKSPTELVDQLAWRHGMLIFDRTPLADVVAQFNRYNSNKLAVVGRAAQMKIDGTFPANNVEDFLHLARDVLGLRISQTEYLATLSEARPSRSN